MRDAGGAAEEASRWSARARRAWPRATTAAERGHRVTLFDAAAEIGGQFNLARRIPGKEEFAETLRYFRTRLAQLGVDVALNHARRRERRCAASTT